jgi:hypothetical protein
LPRNDRANSAAIVRSHRRIERVANRPIAAIGMRPRAEVFCGSAIESRRDYNSSALAETLRDDSTIETKRICASDTLRMRQFFKNYRRATPTEIVLKLRFVNAQRGMICEGRRCVTSRFHRSALLRSCCRSNWLKILFEQPGQRFHRQFHQ